MIQRIQTIFLLLAGASIAGLFFLPFATTPAPTEETIFMDASYNIFDSPVLLAIAGAAIAVALLAIISFKSRTRQLRLGYLGMALCVLIPVVAILFFTSQTEYLLTSDDIDDGLGIFAPLAGLLMFVLANMFIRKDEKLVKSMDRLR